MGSLKFKMQMMVISVAIDETLYLLSVPGMRESIIEGMQENLEETSTELEW